MNNKVIAQLLNLLLILVIPFMLIITSITVLTNQSYLSFEYSKNNFPLDMFGFNPQERFTHAADNLRFIRQNLPAAFLQQQEHNGQPLYNSREVSHMVDVQAVFQAAWTAEKILLILAFFLLAWLTWKGNSWKGVFTDLQYGGILTAVLVAVIGGLAITGWNTWFDTFHQIFFPPGSWTFYETDTLIRLFPLPFWFDSALTVSGLTLIGGVLLAFLAGFLKKMGRQAVLPAENN